MSVSIRAIRKQDAKEIIRLFRDFTAYLKRLGGKPQGCFTEKDFLRDGFGRKKAFDGWVAVGPEGIVGYLIGSLGYETDIAARVFFVIDVYVTPSFQGGGAGGALMAKAARHAVKQGAKAMLWSVLERNVPAAKFYRRLGAKDIPRLYLMSITDKRLDRLAKA